MDKQTIVALLGFGGTLLLVMTGLLNYSVFIRQLRASREQLDTARKQMEHAQQQPAMLLVQRAMAESSEHLKFMLDRPHLRPYFFDNRRWTPSDGPTEDEVKLMAELILNNFASSLIHAAAFTQYPARTVEQTIRFHLKSSVVLREYLLEAFDRFPISGLAIEADLLALIASSPDAREHARRLALLEYIQRLEVLDPLDITRHTLGDAA